MSAVVDIGSQAGERGASGAEAFLARRIVAPALAFFAVAIFTAFALIAPHGYGDNVDNYGMLRAWQEMAAHGVYAPSRFQGNLPSEFLLGTLAAHFGPLGANALSFAASLAALACAYRLLRESADEGLRAALAVATVALNPAWMNAASSSMDYLHPIPVFLLALLCVERRWLTVAAMLLALAGAIRLQYAPPGLAVLVWLAWRDGERRSQTLQALAAFLVVLGLIYVPVFIASHLSFSFLSSYRPTWQGVPGLLYRWAYKGAMLYGLPGSLLAGAALASGGARAWGDAPERARFTALACGLAIIYALALFFYIPVRVEYLLPALVAMAGLFVAARAPYALLLALAAVEFGGWFVTLEPLRIVYTGDRCQGVIAVAATLSPHVASGPLAGPLRGETGETICWPQTLLAQPRRLSDPLPRPAQGSSSESQ